MNFIDGVAKANQKLWENEVQKGGGYTQPWLNLDRGILQRLAAGEPVSTPVPYNCFPPTCCKM